MKYISPLLSDARASVGGATFSKNRGGNYIRAKVAPVQPRTVAQQNARSNLATLSGMWKSLSASQIAGWNALASGITLKDSLGTSYKPTGNQLFVGNNRNLSDAAQTVISAPPSGSPDFEDISPLTLVATAGTPAFTVAPTIGAAPTGMIFMVKATPQVSPGRSYFGKSSYRQIQSFPASAFASLNIRAAYVARFGALIAGQRINVAVSLISIATGFQSIEVTATILVGA